MNILNFANRDLGIDLGTANILVTLRDKGIIYREPSVVAYNKETKQLEIYDWKTNKDISCWSTWHRKMLGPFSSLDECELNSYSLQLSLYKALLQRQGINIGNMFLVWFNENNKSYMLFPCNDLTKAADKLIA